MMFYMFYLMLVSSELLHPTAQFSICVIGGLFTQPLCYAAAYIATNPVQIDRLKLDHNYHSYHDYTCGVLVDCRKVA